MENTLRTGNIGKKFDILEIIERYLISIYFFIGFFEPYLQGILGSFSKYYIFAVMVFLLLAHRRIKIRPFHCAFLIWLIYKIISVLWVENTYIFQLHLLSQIGMVALLIVLTAIPLNEKTINSIVGAMWIGSAMIGVLSLFMSRPYHGVSVTRQVLYLFGQEADPNNQAAFLLVGLAISLYYLIVQTRHVFLSVVTIVANTYSLFLTGSRGGLVGLICIVIILFLVSSRKQSVGKRLQILFLIAAAILIGYYIAKNFLPENIYQRLFDFGSYEGGSDRDVIWSNGLDLLSQGGNILIGAGWGAYYGYNGIYKAMHNTYLSILCDVGIIGFLLFFIPIIQAFFKLIKQRKALPIVILISGLAPSFFVDAINKRFFWNVIFVLFIFYVNCLSRSKERETQ